MHQPIHPKQTFEAWWPYTRLVTSVLSLRLGYFSTLSAFGLLQHSLCVWAMSALSLYLGYFINLLVFGLLH
jgi:hypothetical protein